MIIAVYEECIYLLVGYQFCCVNVSVVLSRRKIKFLASHQGIIVGWFCGEAHILFSIVDQLFTSQVIVHKVRLG